MRVPTVEFRASHENGGGDDLRLVFAGGCVGCDWAASCFLILQAPEWVRNAMLMVSDGERTVSSGRTRGVIGTLYATDQNPDCELSVLEDPSMSVVYKPEAG